MNPRIVMRDETTADANAIGEVTAAAFRTMQAFCLPIMILPRTAMESSHEEDDRIP